MSYQPLAPRQRISDRTLFVWVSLGIVLAATLVAVGIITTRSDDSKDKAAPAAAQSQSATAPPSTPASASDSHARDVVFMAELRRIAPALVDKWANFNLLPNMGTIACGWLDMGHDREDTATRIMQTTYSHDEALAIVDAAKPAYCS